MADNNSVISFEARVSKAGDWPVVILPKSVSLKLPSRGMTLVAVKLNGKDLRVALEPDGKGSHWFKLDSDALKAKTGDESIKLSIESINDWPEPLIPKDIKTGLESDKRAKELWDKITPMARWDWIRWIRSTNNPDTRQLRIKVACSKLKSGNRRPCCFNRSACTVPEVSKNGVLIHN